MTEMTQFPRRTAGELTLPNGEVVWVQTLGALQRDEVLSDAGQYAQMKCSDIRLGGAMRTAVIAEFKEQPVEDLATYLAAHEYRQGRIRDKVEEKYPDLPDPVRKEESEDKWLTVMAEHEKKQKKLEESRKAYEDKLFEEARQTAIALTPKVRLERCVAAYVGIKYAEVFHRQFLTQQIFHVVRTQEDHRMRYFQSVADVSDLDEATLSVIVDFINNLDSVTGREIPTSPAGS